MAKRADWWNEGVKAEDYGLIKGYTHRKHESNESIGHRKKKDEEAAGLPIIFQHKGEKKLHKVLVR